MAEVGGTMTLERFEPNESGIISMLRSPDAMAHWEEVGRTVRDSAKVHAPVLTGALRDSIDSQVTRDPETVVLIRVGSELPYAHIQEMNNRTHRGFLRGALSVVAGAHGIQGAEE